MSTIDRTKQLMTSPSASLGLGIICLLIVTAGLAPWIAPYSPYEQNLSEALLPISHAHWCGTDVLGRDVFSRIIYGSRVTLIIVLMVSLLAAPLGTVIGLVAGYCGHWIDKSLMRLTDIWLSLPSLILALALVVALGPGIENAILAVALTSWTAYARITRAETLRVKQMDYISAARLQGASHTRIVFKHIMPMCIPAILVRVSLDMSGIILSVAGLGFLGLGAQPPLPEWGTMLSTGRNFMLNQWWLITFPGIAIFIVNLGFNLFSDGLRDILDPKLNI